MPDQKAITVYHEAGHAIIAHIYGAKVTGMHIERECVPNGWQGWNGGTDIVWKDLSHAQEVAIAVAGPLAEAKYLAGSPVKFDQSDEMRSFAYEACNWTDERDAIAWEVRFGNGITATVEFRPEDLKVMRIVSGVTCEELVDVLRDIRHLLDNEDCWAAVVSLADQCLTQKVVPVEQVRVGEEILLSIVAHKFRKANAEAAALVGTG